MATGNGSNRDKEKGEKGNGRDRSPPWWGRCSPTGFFVFFVFFVSFVVAFFRYRAIDVAQHNSDGLVSPCLLVSPSPSVGVLQLHLDFALLTVAENFQRHAVPDLIVL